MSLAGDVVILAGGTGSVGGATLRALVERGASVALVSRTRERAEGAIDAEVAPEARARVLPVVADLTQPGQGDAVVAAALRRYDRIDAVVSIAGAGEFVTIADSSPAQLETSVRDNLYVTYGLMVPALRRMLAQAPRPDARSRGRLVVVTAGSSLDPQPRFGLMGVAKAAVNTLMLAIAREHKADGIVANAIVLGTVATARARDYLDAADFAAAASPEEVADVLAFHASDASSGINGSLVHVNARETD